MTCRSSLLWIGISAATFVAPAAGQADPRAPVPEPIGQGCFALEVEGDGPELPASIRIDVFRLTSGRPGGMPNVWAPDQPTIHPLELPQQPGVWNALDRPYGLEVEIQVGSPDRSTLVIFRKHEGSLEGTPYLRGEGIRRADYTLWARPTECSSG